MKNIDGVHKSALETNTVADMLARSGRFRNMSDNQAVSYTKNFTAVLVCMDRNGLWGANIFDPVHEWRLSVADVVMNVLHYVYLETEEDIADPLTFYNFINDYFNATKNLTKDGIVECASKILRILKNDN